MANVSFLDCQEQDSISVKRWYIWWENAYISSTVMHLADIFLNWKPWPTKKITGVFKRKDFAYFITFKSMYLKYVHSGPNSKAIISHNWWDVLWLYLVYSCMWQFFTYFEYRRILESFGINSSQDSLDYFESQMESNNIHYFKFQTWNLALKPA